MDILNANVDAQKHYVRDVLPKSDYVMSALNHLLAGDVERQLIERNSRLVPIADLG